jgi:nucleotide-binding universal stress UspA family protein
MTVQSVLVAYDGTQPSKHALEEAVEIVRVTHAKLTLVCVLPVIAGAYGIEMPPGEAVAETIEAVRTMLATEKASLQKLGVEKVDTFLLEGDPVDRVLEFAEKYSPDLIVVGSRGLSEAGRFFLGSVSDGILHHARCSVLVSKSIPPPKAHGASRAL